jgi:hypothetical protein
LAQQIFSPSKAVAIKDLKRGYCSSWCLVAGGNLLKGGWQVNIINFVAAKFMFGLFVPSKKLVPSLFFGDEKEINVGIKVNCCRIRSLLLTPNKTIVFLT